MARGFRREWHGVRRQEQRDSEPGGDERVQRRDFLTLERNPGRETCLAAEPVSS
jgi:hypothetical protein